MYIFVPWPMAMLFLVDHTQGFYVFGEPRLSTNQGRVWQLWNLGPPWWCWRHTSALLISEIQPLIVWINRPDQWSANLSDSGTPATSLIGESPSPPFFKYLMKHDMMCRYQYCKSTNFGPSKFAYALQRQRYSEDTCQDRHQAGGEEGAEKCGNVYQNTLQLLSKNAR